MVGPGRPFFAWVKARRIASGTICGTVICSTDLVTLRKFAVAEKFGFTPDCARGCPAGITTSGTDSA